MVLGPSCALPSVRNHAGSYPLYLLRGGSPLSLISSRTPSRTQQVLTPQVDAGPGERRAEMQGSRPLPSPSMDGWPGLRGVLVKHST